MTTASDSEKWRRATGGILAVSGLLRFIMVWRGGQLFWPDEDRYIHAHQAATDFAKGDWAVAWKFLLSNVDHFLFKLFAVVPAVVEQGLGWDYRFGALFFSVFSVGNLWLIGKIARRAGGDETEAFLAVAFAASAACLFYFTRHLVPYDLGLFFILASMYFGLGAGWRNALLAGGLGGLGFLSYNGYWQIGGAVLVLGVLARWDSPVRVAGRALITAVGLAAPIAALILWGRCYGLDIVQEFIAFSRTAGSGNLDLGWRFVLEYLWHSEHWVAVLWGLACAAALWPVARARVDRRYWWWLGVVLGVYVSMVVFSDELQKIAIHARTVRCLAPFLCLLSAAAVRRLGVTWPRRAWVAGGIIFFAQAAWNLGLPLTQVFPQEFRANAGALAAARPLEQRAALHLLGAYYIHDAYRPLQPTPPGAAMVYQRRHPLQYEPYLYEGYLRAQRVRFRTLDISMRLVSLAPAATAPVGTGQGAGLAGYPGPLRLTLQLPAEVPPQSDPLLVSGRMSRGDFLYITYLTPTSIKLGFDDWGHGGPVSGPLTVDYAQPLTVTISTGALYPPTEGWKDLRHRLFVKVNDRVIFSTAQETYPAEPGSITPGGNFIGGTTTMPFFSGRVLRVETIDPQEIRAHFAAAKAAGAK